MKKFAFIIIAVVVLGLGYGLISQIGGTDGSSSDDALNGFGSNTGSSTATAEVSYTDAAILDDGGGYLAYSDSNLELAKGKNTVIFFNAAWCPTCQVAKKNFQQNSDKFPEDLVILDADYDDFSELRKEYGVNVQHTFVQINDDGDKLTSWSGSYVVDQISSKLI